MIHRRNNSDRCDFVSGNWRLLTISMFVLLLGMTLSRSAHAKTNENSDEKEQQFTSISIEPDSVLLDGPDSLRGLLIHGHRTDGRIVDLTHRVNYLSTTPNRFTVDETGVVRALANGSGDVDVVFENHTESVPVSVSYTHLTLPTNREV